MFHSVLFIYLIKTVENDCFHLKSYSIREKIQEALEEVIPNENYNTLVKKFDSVKFSSIYWWNNIFRDDSNPYKRRRNIETILKWL